MKYDITGWSVHRSIQGGGDSGGSKGCRWCARLLCVLAYTLQATLLVLALRSLLHRHHFGEKYVYYHYVHLIIHTPK